MKRIAVFAGVALAAAGIGVVGAGAQDAKPAAEAAPAAAAEAAPKKDVGSVEGKYLADFTIKTLEGEDFDWKEQVGKRAKVFVIVSPTCSLCRQEVMEMNTLAADYAAKADVYVVVAANEAGAKRFAGQTPTQFQTLVDDEFKLMTAANFRVNPSTLMVDKEGKIVMRLSQYQSGQAEEILKQLK